MRKEKAMANMKMDEEMCDRSLKMDDYFISLFGEISPVIKQKVTANIYVDEKCTNR